MRKIFILLFISVSVLSFAQNPTVLYLNFVSHNEENPNLTTGEPNWANTTVYQQYRAYIKEIADTISANGGKWNWQSDWKFLASALDTSKETSALKATSNNMNIVNYLEWLSEVEVDAHAHQTTHNYADVAKLLDSLGISPVTVGGFLYDTILTPVAPGKNWSDFENGINGAIYPSFFWKPDILWGASTTDHLTDVENYGIWRPDTMKNFFNDNPNRNLIYIGGGCKIVLDSGFTVSTVIQDVVNAITSLNNNFSSSDFYTATIMMNQRDFDEPGIAGKIGQIIRGLDTYVSQGKLTWMTLTEKKDEWINNFGNPVDADCALVFASVDEFDKDDVTVLAYPNPAATQIFFEMKGKNKNAFTVEIYDMQGRLITSENMNGRINVVSVAEYPAGLYNYVMKNYLGDIEGRGKISVMK